VHYIDILWHDYRAIVNNYNTAEPRPATSCFYYIRVLDLQRQKWWTRYVSFLALRVVVSYDLVCQSRERVALCVCLQPMPNNVVVKYSDCFIFMQVIFRTPPPCRFLPGRPHARLFRARYSLTA